MSGMFEGVKAFFKRPVFVVQIKDGEARRAVGKVRQGFVSDCSDIARQFEIECGKVYGERKANGVEVGFGPEIPERARQRFGNAWSYHQR